MCKKFCYLENFPINRDFPIDYQLSTAFSSSFYLMYRSTITLTHSPWTWALLGSGSARRVAGGSSLRTVRWADSWPRWWWTATAAGSPPSPQTQETSPPTTSQRSSSLSTFLSHTGRLGDKKKCNTLYHIPTCVVNIYEYMHNK